MLSWYEEWDRLLILLIFDVLLLCNGGMYSYIMATVVSLGCLYFILKMLRFALLELKRMFFR